MTGIMGSHWRCESTADETFFCPHCSRERTGDVRKLVRWLSLFDRSVLFLGDAGHYITCRVCRRTYDRSEVGAGTGGERNPGPMAEDERAILSVVAAVIYSDSSIRSVEKRAARAVIRRYTGRDLDAGAVTQLVRTSRERWGDPVDGLRRLACLLDESAKRRIVAAAYLVSEADREIHPEESRLLMRIGDALELAPRVVRDAMKEARGG